MKMGIYLSEETKGNLPRIDVIKRHLIPGPLLAPLLAFHSRVYVTLSLRLGVLPVCSGRPRAWGRGEEWSWNIPLRACVRVIVHSPPQKSVTS